MKVKLGEIFTRVLHNILIRVLKKSINYYYAAWEDIKSCTKKYNDLEKARWVPNQIHFSYCVGHSHPKLLYEICILNNGNPLYHVYGGSIAELFSEVNKRFDLKLLQERKNSKEKKEGERNERVKWYGDVCKSVNAYNPFGC